MSFLAVELEDRLAFEDQVQLFLAARAFIVFLDQRLVGSVRNKEVNPERIDAERVLKWVPGGIVRFGVRNRWD
jgi:hypothetical protein